MIKWHINESFSYFLLLLKLLNIHIINNAYNIGNIIGTGQYVNGEVDIGGIVGSNGGDIRYSYTIDTNEMMGSNTGTIDNCMQLSEKQMKNQENITLEDGSITSFLVLLNKEGEGFIEDTKNDNKGYPILK